MSSLSQSLPHFTVSVPSRAAERCCSDTNGCPLPGQHPDPMVGSVPPTAEVCTHPKSVLEMQLLWVASTLLEQILKHIQLLLKCFCVCVLATAVPPLHAVS